MLRCIGIAPLAITLGLLSASSAVGQVLVFDWVDPTSGSAGGIDATVSATVTAGVLAAADRAASAPEYIARFGSLHRVLNYNAPAGGVADIESTIAFSHPLPDGARLIVIDVDYREETVVIAADGSPPLLVEQIESAAGATSIFPIWNPVAGTLVENAPNNTPNDGEVSVFDISGANTLDLDFLNGATSSGISVAIAIPSSGIPTLPTSGLAILAVLLTATLAIARRPGPRRGRP